ncbi:MAG: extracellular solute-binding protein [Phycisphaerae bacterium]|nr:extracellular solute-binding protein [Phycisphaerae bacterium]
MSRSRFLVRAALAALVLYALYPKAPSHRDVAGGPPATEVTIWFNGPYEGRQLEAVDAFERHFADRNYRGILGSGAVRTNLEGEGNPQRLMCGIAGGVPPEVVEYDRFAICSWAARGAFRDLTEFIERDRRLVEEAEARLAALRAAPTPDAAAIRAAEAEAARRRRYLVDPADYYAPTWEECLYRDPDRRRNPDGKVGLYGIPNYMDTRVLYYNTDLLIQAGRVDDTGSPRPPETWEQILRKRWDVADAETDDLIVRSASAEFTSGDPVRRVRPGDTVSVIAENGAVTRGIVAEVLDAHRLRVRSPHGKKPLSLPKRARQRVKVFDQDGYALTLTRWDDEGRLRCIGFEPQHGNAWLYLYGFANGGEFMSPDGRTCTLDDPRIVEALEWTTDIYDALGGFDKCEGFRKGYQERADHPFYRGQIAMFVNGDWFLRDLARYARNTRFATVAPPVFEARRKEGLRGSTWVAGFAYCIPSTCPPEKLDAAWALIKFLSSPEGGAAVMNEHDAQRERGQGRLYVPRLMANKRLTEQQFRRYIDVPDMPESMKRAIASHRDVLAFGRFRPVSPVGQLLWNAQADAQNIAWSHTVEPRAALQYQAQRVNRGLSQFFDGDRDRPAVPWRILTLAYVAFVGLMAVVTYVRFRRRHRARGFYRREWSAGVLFALPWLVGFIVLSGGPMVFSAVMSFTSTDIINPSVFVGLDNYREMFTVDWGGADPGGKETVPTGVRRALANTLFMALGLPISMAIGLGLALLLDARVVGMKVYRTLFFMPAIMPVVAASVLWLWVFNAQNGLLNYLLRAVGIEHVINWMHAHFDWFSLSTPISWLTNKSTSKPALIIMNLWTAGSSMIIWLAGLKDIPTHLYEAAALDGAGPIRRFFKISLPMLSPYILFNLIIGMIQTFQIFTQAYIMTPNGYPERSTYFYVYKLFDECFSYFRLGYGAAMAWVLVLLLITLTLINMRLSKRWVYYAGE